MRCEVGRGHAWNHHLLVVVLEYHGQRCVTRELYEGMTHVADVYTAGVPTGETQACAGGNRAGSPGLVEVVLQLHEVALVGRGKDSAVCIWRVSISDCLQWMQDSELTLNIGLVHNDGLLIMIGNSGIVVGISDMDLTEDILFKHCNGQRTAYGGIKWPVTWISLPVRSMLPLPGTTSPVHLRVEVEPMPPATVAAAQLTKPAATAKILIAIDEYILTRFWATGIISKFRAIMRRDILLTGY